MDPFHTLVMRRWGVEISPSGPQYVELLGTYSLVIRRYDWSGGCQVTQSFHLSGDDPDDLMRRAADIALRIEQGRSTGVAGTTFVRDHWIAELPKVV